MRKFVLLTLSMPVLVMAAQTVLADSDAIVQRQTILKGFGQTTRPIGAMLRGEAPYDQAVVQKALTTIVDGTKKLPALFPDDSKTGHETEALPKIWDEKAKFVAGYDKLGGDATTALASIKDEASLKAEMPKVLANCKACHDTYRAKK